jgi:hypothetical protein
VDHKGKGVILCNLLQYHYSSSETCNRTFLTTQLHVFPNLLSSCVQKPAFFAAPTSSTLTHAELSNQFPKRMILYWMGILLFSFVANTK